VLQQWRLGGGSSSGGTGAKQRLAAVDAKLLPWYSSKSIFSVALLLLYCYHIKYVDRPCFSTLLVCFIKFLYVVPTFLPSKYVIETEVENTLLDGSTMPCLRYVVLATQMYREMLMFIYKISGK